MASSEGSIAKRFYKLLGSIYKRYFIDAMGAMALGLFASLIIGTIINQMADIEVLAFLRLKEIAAVVQSKEAVGAAIGAAIAWGLKGAALVVFSSAGAGAIGYVAGGPVGALLAAVVGAEVGQLVSKRTPVDIVVTPLVTLVSGGLVGLMAGPYIQEFMALLGRLIVQATQLVPLPMGMAVGTVVGMVLTSPISSVALCVSLQISGLAAGAALAGCCAQMVGFAVISYGDNGFSGLISQGLGTAKLQLPNVLRRPQIWIAPTVASALCGGLAATVFQMETSSVGAGMGTSALVGQITTYAAMAPEHGAGRVLAAMAVLHVVIPALVALAVDRLLRRAGVVRKGDMALRQL